MFQVYFNVFSFRGCMQAEEFTKFAILAQQYINVIVMLHKELIN